VHLRTAARPLRLVIAVETETAPAERSAEGRITLGNQGRSSAARLLKAQAKVGERSGQFDYLVSASHLESDGFRDHARARVSHVNAHAGFAAGAQTRVSVLVNAVDMPLAQNPGALPVDSFRATPSMAWPRNVETGAGESTRQVQAGIRLVHRRAERSADVAVYGLHRSLENPLPFGVIDLERVAGGVRAQYEQALGEVRPIVITAGLDVEAQSDERFEYANDGGRPTGEPRRDQRDRVTSAGPFAQASITAGDASVTAGARYDVVQFATTDRRGIVPDQSGERTLHAPSFMAGVALRTGAGTLFVNAASAFQTPTTTELLNAPPAPGQPCCPTGFNTELEPQRTLSTEAGLRGVSRYGVAYEAVGYLMDVRDALVQFQVPEAEGRDFFRNAGRTRHRGIELSASVAATRGLSLSAAYTLTDVRFRDAGTGDVSNAGNRVPGITPHRLFAAAAIHRQTSRLAVEVQHHARQQANDSNTRSVDAFTIADVRAQAAVRAGAFELVPWAALNNIFDTRYTGSVTVNAAADRFYEPAPGFNVSFGTSIRTGAWRGR
jgi:iron complex outermembrane recepter protein